MSLGGEAILGQLTPREQGLLQEAWIWRAIQLFAYKSGPITVTLDKDELPIITANGRVYHLATDKQQFLNDVVRDTSIVPPRRSATE